MSKELYQTPDLEVISFAEGSVLLAGSADGDHEGFDFIDGGNYFN